MALSTMDAVVLELMTMGHQAAAHLGDLLRASSPSSPHQELAAEILRCCGRVIAALRANGAGGGTKKRKPVDHDGAAAWCPPSTPPRKRARVVADARGVVTTGTMEDGFIWRKYGQKDINGCKHPRIYHRCAYGDQGCTATRRVQRTHDDDEPAAYEIAYYGEHKCRGAATCQPDAPPTVIDFGSNAWGCGTTVPAASSSEQQLWSCFDGEMSQGGWSSSSSSSVSSEVGFEAQATQEWHDTAQVEVPSPTPSDPVMEFLDGCIDWEAVINHVPVDFGAQLPSHW